MDGKTLSVIQLNEYVKNVFEDELILHDITVYGEIYQISHSGTSTFVSLREGDSLIHCLHFGALESGFVVGQKVKLYGSVRYFTKNGKLNFIFKSIRPYGKGELYENFLRLKNQLEREGLFAGKKPVPACIRRIAVVTSETGAVIHDFLFAVHRYRDFGEVDVYTASVQGSGAAEEIANAIGRANTSKKRYDVLVVARGGGATDDLEAFNTEKVARAVAGSAIPVISAVGHETDYTLCDFCASLRAGTPSIAGETIANVNGVLFDRLKAAARNLGVRFRAFFSGKRQRLLSGADKIVRLSELKTSLCAQKLRFESGRLRVAANALIPTKTGELTRAVERLGRASESNLSGKQALLSDFERRLDKNSPLRILSQGYAKVYSAGRTLESAEEVSEGGRIDVYLRDGKLEADVISKQIYKKE